MSAISDLQSLYAQYQALDAAIGLMGWDRQVMMPPGGAAARSLHIARLTSMAHQLITSDSMRRALEAAARNAAPDTDDAAIVRVLQREIDSESKLPLAHVERMARVASDAYEVWKRARAESDFPAMLPFLEELFDLNREKAELLGYKDHIYDPLIDLFEEGATFADADRMFKGIKQPIIDLVRAIKEEGRPVDDTMLRGDWDRPRLRQFAEETTAKIGFDYNRGRLDLAPNAFCGGSSSGDIRMSTRASDHIKGVVSSSLHEMGHGLYEQGSPPEWDRTPLSGGVSLAIHESQSRLWENIIGRSRGFWRCFLPKLQRAFPQIKASAEEFYRMINKVDPTYIRVGADELTYNLHILVRFELECEILTGALAVKELPEAWNAKYSQYLGITPRNVGEGCLQDVHWTRGMVGYFPTYAMGNLIGGQIWHRLQQDIPDTETQMESGNFGEIHRWLKERIYRQGKRYAPKELLQKVVGEEMKPDAWLGYADSKYRAIYGLG